MPNLFRASWSRSLFYTSEMSLWWKPSFNLEFNKNWLSIMKHKQSCTINLSALFVLGRKQALSAEADDRCWLKDKYYLYFLYQISSYAYLIMHGYMINKAIILYQSKTFKCTLAPWECFKEFGPRVQLNQDGEKRKFWKKNKYWNSCYLKCTLTDRLMNIYALKITLFWTYAYAF